MAGSLERCPCGGFAGGILGLVRLLERFGEAIEYDLLTHGLNRADLGTLALSWRDLLVLVKRWQKLPGTALCEAINGVVWSTGDQLLAELLDSTHSANWQRAGKKSAPKPKRIPRPWEKNKKQSLGSEPIPISKFAAWWDSFKK